MDLHRSSKIFPNQRTSIMSFVFRLITSFDKYALIGYNWI